MKSFIATLTALAMAVVIGCSGGTEPPADPGPETVTDPMPGDDASMPGDDAPADAPADPPADAPADPPADAPADPPAAAPADAPADKAPAKE